MVDEDNSAHGIHFNRPVISEKLDQKVKLLQEVYEEKKHSTNRSSSTLEFFPASSSSKLTLPESQNLFEWLLVIGITAFISKKCLRILIT